MKTPVTVGFALMLSAVMSGTSASALDRQPTKHGTVHAAPTSAGFTVAVTDEFGAETHEANGSQDGLSTPQGFEVVEASPAQVIDMGTRLFSRFCAGTNWISACDATAPSSAPQPRLTSPAVPQVTPTLVLSALRRLALPVSDLKIQPPNGRTLVNFETNFYTEQPAFDRTVTLLGRRVDLQIWPSQFRWVFGDGAELTSTSAGAPYPNLLITHNYLQRGGVSPRVDTTYSARFRVDGGAWRDVDGTVTIPGPPVSLRVITATPVLVGSD